MHITIFNEIDAICKSKGLIVRKYDKMKRVVDLKELDTLTKNLSDDIEGLAYASQSSAKRLIKVSNEVQLYQEAAEKLKTMCNDSMKELESNTKSESSINTENLEKYIMWQYDCGILLWSKQIKDLLEEGQLSIDQTINSETSSLVTILLEGNHNTGRTALAAKIAKKSCFPFIKFFCSRRVFYSETAQADYIHKVGFF